jgi:tetratricopeptide (TPR) repeat protein
MRNETSGGPLQTCELRASLAGFRSDSLILAGRTFSHPDVGTIVLHRMGKVQGSTISVTTMQAPKAAKNAFQRARNAADKQKWQEAQEQLQEAVRIYPKYAAAWLDLGMLESKANHKAEAQKAFEQALAADPDYIPSYYQLAALAAQAKQWERVAELTDKALALNSYEFAPLYLYNGVAYLNLRKLDKAEASARAARRLDSQYKFPAIDLLLGQILAERQDFGGAAEQLRSFLKHAPNAPQAEQVRAQLTSLEKQAAATKNP